MKTLTMYAGLNEHYVKQRSLLFEEMYQETFPMLYRFVHYRVGDRQTAEDLTSMIFERALTRLELFDADKGSFSTWLFSIARRVVANHFRSQHRKPAMVLLDEDIQIEGPDCNPEETLLQLRQQQLLQEQLLALPEREQEIIALRFGAGLSNREIGRLIGLSESNVGTILHRAVQKMRKTFQNEGWDL